MKPCSLARKRQDPRAVIIISFRLSEGNIRKRDEDSSEIVNGKEHEGAMTRRIVSLINRYRVGYA